MGLELEHVQSEHSHSVTFVCNVCSCLADMNACVTTKCSHLFCKPCIEDWLTKSTACPTCQLSMESQSNAENDSLSRKNTPQRKIGISSLQSSQPLAYACMSRIKVCCPQCKTWTGEYGKLPGHVKEHQSHRDVPPHERTPNGRPITRRRSDFLPSHEGLDGNSSRRSQSLHHQDAVAPTADDIRQMHRRRSALSGTTSESTGLMNDSHVKANEIGGDTKSRLPREKEGILAPSTSSNKAALCDASMLKEKGNSRFNKGEYLEAQDFYDHALAAVKGMALVGTEEKHAIAALYCNRGATLARRKLVDEACRDYDTAIKIAPDCQKAYARKFKLLASKGRLVEAKSLLEAAVLNVPSDKSLLDELKITRRILVEMGRVRELLQRHQYIEAQRAGAALMKMTDSTEAVLVSAEADASIGVIEPAIEKCEYVMRNDPTNAVCWRTKGYVLLVANMAEEAGGLLKEALKLDPTNGEAKKVLGFCRKIQGEFSKAKQLLDSAEGSRSMLKKAIEIVSSLIDEGFVPPCTPLMCNLLTKRGECELRLTHYVEALSDANNAIKANQRCTKAWNIKSKTLITMGRAHEARNELLIAKQTWASNDAEINDAFKRADFEAKVHDADKELRDMLPNATMGGKAEEHTDESPTNTFSISSKIRMPIITLNRRPSYDPSTSRDKKSSAPDSVTLSRRPSYDPSTSRDKKSSASDSIRRSMSNFHPIKGERKNEMNGRRFSVGAYPENDAGAETRRGSYGDEPKTKGTAFLDPLARGGD